LTQVATGCPIYRPIADDASEGILGDSGGGRRARITACEQLAAKPCSNPEVGPMTKWEYKVDVYLTSPAGPPNYSLLGKEGWELVSVVAYPVANHTVETTPFHYEYHAFFKRPLAE
jgi:hypothetical protein